MRGTLTLEFTLRDPVIDGCFGVRSMKSSRPLTRAEEKCIMQDGGLYWIVGDLHVPQWLRDGFKRYKENREPIPKL